MVSVTTILKLLSLPVKLLWVVLSYPIFGGANLKFKNNLRNSLKLTIFRFGLSLPVKDSAYLAKKSTQQVINSLKPVYPRLTSLPSYGKSYDKLNTWVVEAENRSKSDPLVIYLHGGGYRLNTAPAQVESLLNAYYLLDEEKRKKTSILVLDYSLTCHGHYVGTQVYELAATYRKLVAEGNDNFILMGDSAGANLGIAFLQYLRQEKDSNLPWPKSAVLISPWVKIVPDAYQLTPGHSYYDNEKYDMLSGTVARSAERRQAMFGGENYADLLKSPGNLPYKKSDWSDIPTFNNKGYSTFVLFGEHELFRDDIREWTQYALDSPLTVPKQDSKGVFDPRIHEYKTTGQNGAFIDVVLEPWGIHVAPLLFENDVTKALEKQPNLKLKDIDERKFLGTVKIASFLNQVL
ncbi:hypothetical protein KGF57_002983 [Candida theae]|uniref:Alpha/beta hydrolase fold-3 domain-containing protein n=1 Tax=Candida theae TaxID=1198502 RepID=A0AAD5BDT3_9ASCO|nr:uncharacterized protein KGF57_002983 [Candida theae]KAI5957717.1 hypothetical protein KGF57_002983 [Candida theae]